MRLPIQQPRTGSFVFFDDVRNLSVVITHVAPAHDLSQVIARTQRKNPDLRLKVKLRLRLINYLTSQATQT